MAETFTTYYHSPVGLLKISGNKDFISEVTFHDTTQKSDGSKKDIPPMVINCIEQLIQYFNGERRIFELPINQTGTSFQQETWNQLVTIPFGKTISYIQLAIRTGDPKANTGSSKRQWKK